MKDTIQYNTKCIYIAPYHNYEVDSKRFIEGFIEENSITAENVDQDITLCTHINTRETG